MTAFLRKALIKPVDLKLANTLADYDPRRFPEKGGFLIRSTEGQIRFDPRFVGFIEHQVFAELAFALGAL